MRDAPAVMYLFEGGSGDAIGTGAAMSDDDRIASDLRGFGPLGILAILAILLGALLPPLGAVLVLLWAWRSRTPWHEIGYTRPGSWVRTVVVGTPLGIVFKFLMKAIVMPLLGASPVNQAYRYLAGNLDSLPGAIFTMIVIAGLGEETLFRGWMFERLGRRFGHSPLAKVVIVLLTTVLFALAHYPGQGLPGTEQAIITGLVFGTIFGITGRIWLVMTVHAAFDLTALWMIYGNLETWAAHLVFK
jgi:membrane protease YdiL (CAAX protease family)